MAPASFPAHFTPDAMKRKIFPPVILLQVLLLLSLSACGGSGNFSGSGNVPTLPHDMPIDPPPGSTMLTANTYAGDALSAMLLQRVSSGSGILVASMVDMENLDSSSPFGRTSMQQISSRVAQHGFKVMDVRLTGEMVMELKGGEFMLSRNTTRLLARDHDAHAVLVGIASRSGSRVFISTRAIRLADNAVIAAYEYYLPLADDTRYMLGEAGGNTQGSRTSDKTLWARYATRGQAFPGKEYSKPVGIPPTPYEPAASQAVPTRTGNAAVISTSGGTVAPYGAEATPPANAK